MEVENDVKGEEDECRGKREAGSFFPFPQAPPLPTIKHACACIGRYTSTRIMCRFGHIHEYLCL